MSAVSVAVPRVVPRTRLTSFFLLATFFSVTFEKVHWNLAGTLGLTGARRSAAIGGTRTASVTFIGRRWPCRSW